MALLSIGSENSRDHSFQKPKEFLPEILASSSAINVLAALKPKHFLLVCSSARILLADDNADRRDYKEAVTESATETSVTK